MNILILCTGNSCRSQMAEAILKAINPALTVASAGTKPEKEVNPYAVKVMAELGIDISGNYPKLVDEFLQENWDYVITVCDSAKENCPVFLGNVKEQIHIGFEDPAKFTGTEEEILNEFRRVRDLILREFFKFHNLKIRNV